MLPEFEKFNESKGRKKMSEKKVWFITGCSTGFGRELAKQLLENDYRVVVTARNADKVQDLVEINKENALALALDVTDKTQVAEAVAKAEEHFGAIDVLVNNAGFGYSGAIEESDEREVRAMFEANSARSTCWSTARAMCIRAACSNARKRTGTSRSTSTSNRYIGP